MFTVEVHNSHVDRPHTGSFMAHFGARSTISTIAEVQRRLQGIGDDLWHRAYCMYGGVPMLVWGRTDKGIIHPIACADNYKEEAVAFISPDTAGIAVGKFGVEVTTLAEGTEWARGELRAGMATAILVDLSGVYAAWEPGPEEPHLVACRVT